MVIHPRTKPALVFVQRRTRDDLSYHLHFLDVDHGTLVPRWPEDPHRTTSTCCAVTLGRSPPARAGTASDTSWPNDNAGGSRADSDPPEPLTDAWTPRTHHTSPHHKKKTRMHARGAP